MRIYLDYAATTPVDPAVFDAMKPYFSRKFGNPSSLHFFGQEAMAAVDEGREKIAKIIGAPPAGGFREIIFTGSATESNNLALRGVARALKTYFQKTPSSRPASGTRLDRSASLSSLRSEPCPLGLRDTFSNKFSALRIIVSSIEHESILKTARDLESEGIEVVYLPVNRNGVVDLKKLKNSLDERVILVSVMFANNETGSVQPIKEIAKTISEFKMQNLKLGNKNSPKSYPLLHVDAAQAFQFLDCGVGNLGVDLMTLSAHKIYGPKGIGALYVKNLEFSSQNLGVKKTLNPKSYILSSIIAGGNQEFSLRSGTENVPAIVGFAKAIELAARNRDKESKRIEKLRDYFWQKIKKIEPKARLNNNALNCLPNILNIYFPSYNSQDLLVKLDLAGVAVSSGAACAARSLEPSYVLAACGFSSERIKSSLRFSLGKFTIKSEIDEALKRLKAVIKN